MTRKPGTLNKEQIYREAFLARLNQKLAAPTSNWPTVRYWTKPALDKLFRQIREELVAEQVKSDLSHASLLDWLCHLRLATLLPIENESVFLFEIGASSESEVDPFELLMAAKPSGVICYFSAVVFHELTTQMVEHHHVAELQSPRATSDKKHSPKEVSEPLEASIVSENRAQRGLGKLLFQFQGVPFYSTRRSSRLVPGVQTRVYGPRAQIRITTLEQTLLDTLYNPFACGGPEVVFEAWQKGVASRRIDEERLVKYLLAMNYPATVRRLAVMLEVAECVPGEELRRFFDTSQAAIDRQNPYAHISLLPGLDYKNLNERWLVNMP